MKKIELSKKIYNNPWYFIAFGFGSGLMPMAPGTWGTLAAIPIYLLLVLGHYSLACYLIWTLIAFFVGIVACNKVSQELGAHDYPGIVWDEIVGYLVTMIMVPVGFFWIIAGFLLFRLFDVWKPYPISWVDENVKGGLGIMLDDVCAAIPAGLIMQLLVWGMAK